MEDKTKVEESIIQSVLEAYGLDAAFHGQKMYINHCGEDNFVKVILSVVLYDGRFRK